MEVIAILCGLQSAVSILRQNQPVHQHQIRKAVKLPENRLPVSTWQSQ